MPDTNEIAAQSHASENLPNIKHADYLYVQVLELCQDWRSVDLEKARLIIERATDAIASFGKTNHEKKVQLKEIIEKAEQVIPPDSIESLKKRAEKFILKFIYPKSRRLRNVLVAGVGAILFLSIGGTTLLAVRSFLEKDPLEKKQLTQEESAQKAYEKTLAEGLLTIRPEEALKHYREARRIDPNDEEIKTKIKELEDKLTPGGSK